MKGKLLSLVGLMLLLAVPAWAVAVTVTTKAAKGGTIAPAGAVTVADGASQVFSITPMTGYHVVSVIVDGVDNGPVTSVTAPADLNMALTKHSISARFAINTYNVSASAGAGGTITPTAAQVRHGKSAKFTITPIPGKRIERVLVNGVPKPGFPLAVKKYKLLVPVTGVTEVEAVFDLADVDNDGDGYSENQGDCNDAIASVKPGATEVCGNGIDEDCSGADLTCDDVDNDGDGHTENQGDCDDADAGINPAATEICGDGVDQDCSGADLICPEDIDDDGDGYTPNQGDCDDNNIAIHPAAVEVVDGIDNNCDGRIDDQAPLDMTEELEQTKDVSIVVPDVGTYAITTYLNAETAQTQITEENFPNVLEEQGRVLVLDLTEWPEGWDVMKIVAVRMPDGRVEYKRIINRFILDDGRYAIGALDVSALEVIDSGSIDLGGESSAPSSATLARSLVNIIDYSASHEIELLEKLNVNLFDYSSGGTSASLGFPEISLTATPKVTFKLDIDKPFGWSGIVGYVADVSVNIIQETKDILQSIDGAVTYSDGRGIVSAGVNLAQADNVVNAILAVSEVAQKLEAVLSVLSDKRRIKLGYAEISGDIKGVVSLRAYASTRYSKSGEVYLGTVLVPITGPVPIFLKFDLYGIYSMQFDASVEATTSLTVDIPIKASVSIIDGNFSEPVKPSFSPVVTFSPPLITGNGEFEASAGLKVEAGASLAGLLDLSLNPKAEAVFESSILAQAAVGGGVCSNLEWDLYGRVSTELEAELDLKVIRIGKTWDTPLTLTVYKDSSPMGTYLFGTCPADGLTVATPTFSPSPGTYTSTQNVTLTSTAGATIRYTTNGSTPTASSTLYSGPISVSSTTTIKAKAFKSGWTDSAEAPGAYTINAASNWAYGPFARMGSAVAITTASDFNASCSAHFGSSYRAADWNDLASYYQSGASLASLVSGLGMTSTGEGGAVTRSGATHYSSGRQYHIAFFNHTLPSGWLAHANLDDHFISLGSWTGPYRLICYAPLGTVATPTFSPSPGTYTSTQSVTLSTSTAGADIRYTTNGSTPTASSTLYSGPISVSSTTTIKAKAFKASWTDSPEASGTYTIQSIRPSTVTSPTGRVWMDRNLGATRVATAYNDSAAYGDLYQWGRGTDGHEKRTSPTTTTLSSSDTPGHGSFILNSSSPYDWRSPQNNTLWQGVTGVNNPCPSGFRLPTSSEWEAERATWSSNNHVGAFTSPLKLVTAGYHPYNGGAVASAGIYGNYWSSSVDGEFARMVDFYSGNARTDYGSRANGVSVRCIED